MEQVNECTIEYGLKVNEKNSNVVCIMVKLGGEDGRWQIGIYMK